MKYHLSFFLAGFTLLSSSLNAAILNCEIAYNLEPVYQTEVVTETLSKTLIGEAEGITAYITEKANNQFILEAFLADYDIRGYSEGKLVVAGDKMSFSLWGRTSMADVSCELAKK